MNKPLEQINGQASITDHQGCIQNATQQYNSQVLPLKKSKGCEANGFGCPIMRTTTTNPFTNKLIVDTLSDVAGCVLR